MTWVKIDEHTFEDPKIEAVSQVAGWFWLAALCYCNSHRTDGRITPVGIAKIAAMSKTGDVGVVMEELRMLDMLYPDDSEDGSWWIVNYAKYQPLSSRVARDQEMNRQRQARFRERHGPGGDPNGVSNGSRNGVTGAGMLLPERQNGHASSLVTPEALAEMRRRKRASA